MNFYKVQDVGNLQFAGAVDPGVLDTTADAEVATDAKFGSGADIPTDGQITGLHYAATFARVVFTFSRSPSGVKGFTT